MQRGPKAGVDPSPLPFKSSLKGAARFAAFCRRYIVTPKGHGVGKPMILRPWQVKLVGAILDPPQRPRTAGIMMPRGQGKTSLMAALCVYTLFTGPEGTSVVVAAVDQRQAELTFKTAARMVELNPELLARCQVFRERLEIPAKGGTFVALPAEAKRLEGLDYTLAILDEIGVIARDTYETVLLAQGKRPESTVIGVGTPSASSDSVLLDMRQYGLEHPEDLSFVWREFSAAGFEDHDVDCRHCWTLANPAMSGPDPFLAEDAMTALLPPKTREGSFRRARLCQFVGENLAPFIPADVWDSLSTGESIPDGTPVVIALDGSFSDDTTALLLGTVSAARTLTNCRFGRTPETTHGGCRSLPEHAAVELTTSVAGSLFTLGQTLGAPVEVVSRSDSTLRGHVLAEMQAIDAARRRVTGTGFDGVLLVARLLRGRPVYRR